MKLDAKFLLVYTAGVILGFWNGLTADWFMVILMPFAFWAGLYSATPRQDYSWIDSSKEIKVKSRQRNGHIVVRSPNDNY